MAWKSPEFPKHLDRTHLTEPEWGLKDARIGMYAVNSEPDFPQQREAREGAGGHARPPPGAP